MDEASLEFLKSIVNTPSPSGYEEWAAELFRKFLASIADEVQTDVHGNVWGSIRPDARIRIMLAGHLDEIGFAVHYITEEGNLRFTPIGDHHSIIPVGQRVYVHGEQTISGVIGWTPVHLSDEEDRKRLPSMDELWIDIGVSSRSEAERLVQMGDPVTFEDEFRMLQGDRAVARGFDNKAGCFVVAHALNLLKESEDLHPDVGVFAVGTVQEEIGFRGAQTSAYSIDPHTALAVDVTHATDHPGASRDKTGSIDIGGGPVIARGANINPAVFTLLRRAAKEDGIPLQIEVAAESSETDAHAIQTSRRGVATGLVSIPVRYMHTPCELLSLNDLEQASRLLAAYCRRVTPDVDFTPRPIRGHLI